LQIYKGMPTAKATFWYKLTLRDESVGSKRD